MTVESEKPTCLDFFAGSGLVSEGLKDFFNSVWANDNCSKKAKVFRSNHNPDIFEFGSIEDVVGQKMPSAVLSWGSFPCQDLSLAGNMGGLSSARSGLVWEWLRVMDELSERPPIAVAENVVGLVSTDKGENYRKLHQELVKRGYKVGAVMLDALHWLPQSRKRIFVIAVDKFVSTTDFETDGPTWCHTDAIVRAAKSLEDWVWWDLPQPVETKQKLQDIVEFNAECVDAEKQKKLLSLVPEKHMRLLQLSPLKVFPGYKRIRHGKQVLELRFDGVAGCLRTPKGGSSRQFIVIKEGNDLKVRLLTIKETAALMGAPRSYALPGTYNDAYQAMGDAVAVPVTHYLAQHLLSPLATTLQKRQA